MSKDKANTFDDEVKVGRLQVFSRLKKTTVRNYLLKLSRQYIEGGADQMVIFSFDHIGHSVNLYGCYEHEGLKLIGRWLERQNLIRGSAIDIGANIGNHSLFFSKYYRNVFAFEPNPRTYEVLRLNSKLADNILTYDFGLSDTPQSLTLVQDDLNIGHSAVAPRVERPKARLTQFDIKVRPLDEVIEIGQTEIGLIKIDVEGHELQALVGASRTIRSHMPVILFEQHAGELQNGTSKVINYLRSLGYRRFAVLRERPVLPDGIPGVLRIPLTNFARLLMGTTYFIKEIERFKTAFYSVIIAMPR